MFYIVYLREMRGLFKYKDDSVSDNEIGVTEFCGVASGHLDEFAGCGTKSFRTYIKQPH